MIGLELGPGTSIDRITIILTIHQTISLSNWSGDELKDILEGQHMMNSFKVLGVSRTAHMHCMYACSLHDAKRVSTFGNKLGGNLVPRMEVLAASSFVSFSPAEASILCHFASSIVP